MRLELRPSQRESRRSYALRVAPLPRPLFTKTPCQTIGNYLFCYVSLPNWVLSPMSSSKPLAILHILTEEWFLLNRKRAESLTG